MSHQTGKYNCSLRFQTSERHTDQEINLENIQRKSEMQLQNSLREYEQVKYLRPAHSQINTKLESEIFAPD